jgi:hypothetical protein
VSSLGNRLWLSGTLLGGCTLPSLAARTHGATRDALFVLWFALVFAMLVALAMEVVDLLRRRRSGMSADERLAWRREASAVRLAGPLVVLGVLLEVRGSQHWATAAFIAAIATILALYLVSGRRGS